MDIPGAQKYAKACPVGLCLEVLVHHLAYFAGPRELLYGDHIMAPAQGLMQDQCFWVFQKC